MGFVHLFWCCLAMPDKRKFAFSLMSVQSSTVLQKPTPAPSPVLDPCSAGDRGQQGVLRPAQLPRESFPKRFSGFCPKKDDNCCELILGEPGRPTKKKRVNLLEHHHLPAACHWQSCDKMSAPSSGRAPD